MSNILVDMMGNSTGNDEFAKTFMGMEWGTLKIVREAHADGGNVLCQV
jgi:hypothetical protein